MRRHVSRVMCFGSDVSVTARGRQRENRVIRIVKRMNYVVSGARMIRVLLIDVERDRAGLRLQAIALVFWSNKAEKRQRIERGRVEIFRVSAIDLLHRR